MRKGGPDFKRYTREHPLPVQPATYHASDLELQVLSGSVTETYFVYGSENFTAHLRVKLANTGRQPITVGMKTLSASRVGDTSPSTTYFSDIVLQPGAQADATINIPAGLTSFVRPAALHYLGVQMDLHY